MNWIGRGDVANQSELVVDPMFRIAVCDDDRAMARRLEELIESVSDTASEPITVETFSTVNALLERMQGGIYYDIVFGEVLLTGSDALALFDEIRKSLENESTALVAYTWYEDYFKDLYAYGISDFVSKPPTANEVKRALLKACDFARKRNLVYVYQFNNITHVAPYADILYFESERRFVKVITDRVCKRFYGKLDDVQAKIGTDDFVRIHHSILLNCRNVVEFTGKHLLLSNGHSMMIARSKQTEVSKKILAYFERKTLLS